MIRTTLITLGSVLLGSILIYPATCFAQTKGSSAPTNGARRDTMLGNDTDLQNRQNQLMLLNEPNKVKVLTEEDKKAIMHQIFEDFERLQVINKEMVKATSRLDNDSYKQISSLADEVNKRAKRLKTNLNIPDIEPDEKKAESKVEMDAAQLKASVLSLNVSVKSFCVSPVFTNPKVTTVGTLQNLRKDISDVIEMSRTVKKAASKLQD
ncbi:MAG TPA: hypothetical protein VFI24_23190 [Pyrinomonadaceae bacterium]|nr:hypothetical protein [Pyrinomonadaceae bacterium]